MSIWKDQSSSKPAPSPVPAAKDSNRFGAAPATASETAPATAPAARAEPTGPRKESLIAADITIEGKIDGSGSVRIHGKFKGEVNVQGDLTIEPGAKVTAGVHADKVVIAGELEGNIDGASRVELLQTGVVIGDIKASSMAIAAGARMRGQVEFGWDDNKAKTNGNGNGAHAESGLKS